MQASLVLRAAGAGLLITTLQFGMFHVYMSNRDSTIQHHLISVGGDPVATARLMMSCVGNVGGCVVVSAFNLIWAVIPIGARDYPK